MIDTVLNLMFRCSHRKMTRPITPSHATDAESAETYVVCLDCGKRFPYDLAKMQVRRQAGGSKSRKSH